MGIERVYSGIDQYMQEQIERVMRLLIRNLSYVGEACVKEGREKGSYTDQTGNLRSSIGYVLVVDGEIVQSGGFEGEGKEGSTEGRSLAEKLAKSYKKGVVLIVVAGMSYAVYVAAKGYDVLASSEIKAKDLAQKMLKQIGFR